MPHVEQRLLVHRLVLEDREERLALDEQRMVGPIDIVVRERVDHAAIRFVANARDRRAAATPDRRVRSRGLRLVRIDAAGEHRLQPRVDARPPSAFFTSVLKLKPGRWPRRTRPDGAARSAAVIRRRRAAFEQRARAARLRRYHDERRASRSTASPDRRSHLSAKRPPQGKISCSSSTLVRITLNGDPFELDRTVDGQRTARRSWRSTRGASRSNTTWSSSSARPFDDDIVREGDPVEIVNFVGGG